MSRQSSDERDASGRLINGFDYDVQVWVRDGRIQNCGHTTMSPQCCNARRFAGEQISTARAVLGLDNDAPTVPSLPALAPLEFTESERQYITAALRIAATAYDDDAKTMRESAQPGVARQFENQARIARELADRIDNA